MKETAENRGPRIIVDADACPRTVLDICKRLAREKNGSLITVANHNHSIKSDCHITVGRDPQQADMRIVNMADDGDIVITQDLGLAAMVLPKGVCCLNPSGRRYRKDNIDMLLEIREAKAKFRRSGGRTGGPSKRTGDDDLQFEKALRCVLEDAVRSTNR